MSFPNNQPTGGIYPYLGAPPLPSDMDVEEEENEFERPPIIDWDDEGDATIPAPPSDDDELASPPRDEIEEQASF